jgi:hypothetical protein
MTLTVVAVTRITCDGSLNMPCPDNAGLTFEHPQTVAIRLAQRAGWLIGVDAVCPQCRDDAPARLHWMGVPQGDIGLPREEEPTVLLRLSSRLRMQAVGAAA